MWSQSDSTSEERLKFLPTHEEEENQQHKCSCHRGRTTKRPIRSTLTLIISILIVILLAFDVLLRVNTLSGSCQELEQVNVPKTNRSEYFAGNGFSSELPSLRDVITYSPQNYTGALTYNTTTKRVAKTPDGPISYFGHPSPELDSLWDDLLDNEFPILYDHEIEAPHMIESIDRMPYDDKIHFEPDVFHNLHCLNAIRQHVNMVLYPDVSRTEADIKHAEWVKENLAEDWDIMHIEHCMDRIRQDLMCHGDLTPSPLHIFPGFPLALGRTGERICRDWAPIRKWMDKRWNEGLEMVQKEQKDKEEKEKEEKKAKEERKENHGAQG